MLLKYILSRCIIRWWTVHLRTFTERIIKHTNTDIELNRFEFDMSFICIKFSIFNYGLFYCEWTVDTVNYIWIEIRNEKLILNMMNIYWQHKCITHMHNNVFKIDIGCSNNNYQKILQLLSKQSILNVIMDTIIKFNIIFMNDIFNFYFIKIESGFQTNQFTS